MLPNVLGKKATKKSIIKYSYFMYFISFVPYLLDYASDFYLAVMLILNTYFLYLAHQVDINDYKTSKKLFKFSIIYLFLLFIAMLADFFFQLLLIK